MAVPSRQDTALFVIERSGEWTRWSADISAYAGTIAEIRFSLGSYYVPGKSGAYEMYLDGINITSFPVPEPGLILFTVGCAAFLVPVRMKHLSDSRGSRRGRQNACFGYP